MDYVWDVEQEDFENWKQWSKQDVSWDQYQAIIADRPADSQIVRPTVNLVKTILQLLKRDPTFENAGIALDIFHRGLKAIKQEHGDKTKVAINNAVRQHLGGELLLESIAEATKIKNEVLTSKLQKIKDIFLGTMIIGAAL